MPRCYTVNGSWLFFMADRKEFSTPSSSSVLETRVDATSPRFEANMRFVADIVSQVRNEEEKIREGGGLKAIESQHNKGRLTARCWWTPVAFLKSDLSQPTACTKNGAVLRPQE